MRVPEGFMRDSCRNSIENHAASLGHHEITLEIAESGMKLARSEMEKTIKEQNISVPKAKPGVCPFGFAKQESEELPWTSEAEDIVQSLPEGMSRDMTRKAVVTIAAKNNLTEITADFVKQILDTFKSGSKQVSERMEWNDDARDSLSRVPDMVRGMLIREVESWAKRNQRERVDLATVSTVKQEWQSKGYFHLDPADPRSSAS
jgi:hypothetical protein